MYRLAPFILFFIFMSSGIFAQDQTNFNRINNETYRLYLEEDWDSLIDMGKEALKLDIDYYYLRMRMGIALYEQKIYKKASSHFRKALDMNQDDPVAMEYLYYSRLLSGNVDQANLMRIQFKGDLAKRFPLLEGKFFGGIGIESLYSRGMIDHISSDPNVTFPGLPSGVQYLTQYYYNTSLSLVNRIAPGFSLFHGYTYLSKTNRYYYNDGTTSFYVSDQNVYQHQYYLSPRITTVSGFKIMPMFHRIKGHYQVPVETTSPGQMGNSGTTLYYTDFTDYAVGLSLVKDLRCIDLTIGAFFATLNQSEQIQNRLGFTWYPLGNPNLFAGGYLNSQYEISNGEGEFRLIPELHIGFSISDKLWFDLNATAGEMTNYLENNGYIVYNSFSESIKKKVKFTISIPVSDKGSLLYLGGRWSSNQSEFYALVQGQSEITNSYLYNTLSFYGGISWEF